MANRYAFQQQDRSFSREWLDAVLACTPVTSLLAGLALAAVGYLLQQPAVAAGGALASAVGLYVERLQARALRRRRRAERMRSQHEITELRRTIAQLRQDVDAFQRALLDTEAVLAARSRPLLVSVTPVAPVAAVGEAAPEVVPALATPLAGEDEQVVVVPLADAEAHAWVQTPARDATDDVALPAQRSSPFVGAVGGPLPLLPPSAPTPDALLYDALAEPDAGAVVRSLAHAPDPEPAGVVPVAVAAGRSRRSA